MVNFFSRLNENLNSVVEFRPFYYLLQWRARFFWWIEIFCSHQIKTDVFFSTTGVEGAGGERKVQNSVLHEHGLRATSQKISRPKPAKKKHFDCKLNSFHKKTIIINYLILIKNWSCYVWVRINLSHCCKN